MRSVISTPEAEVNTSEAEALLHRVLAQVTVTHAADLARIGKFDEAEHLIEEICLERSHTAPALDLLARIRCQQGRLYEAEAFWTQAVRLDPDNEAYRSGLRQIARIRRRPVWKTSLKWLITGALIIAAIFVAGLIIRGYLRELREFVRREARDAASAASLPTSGPQQKESDQVLTAPGGVEGGTAKSAGINLKLSGISTEELKDGLLVKFDSGLFARSDVLKPEARRVLTDLGKELGARGERIRIEINGHTDNLKVRVGSRVEDNYTLGMNRALAVYGYLKQHTQLPASSFSLNSTGESQSPFPNDNSENRAKNQTVTLKISER